MPEIDPYLVPKRETPQSRVYRAAERARVPTDIADDYLSTTAVESGHNINVRASSKGALGFGQVMPDVKGGTTRTVGGRAYNLKDPDENIEAGLRYFSEGGSDPVARRLHYFGGPGARKRYERTGRIPSISDGNMTASQYVKATGGQQAPQDPYLVPKPTAKAESPQTVETTDDPYLVAKPETVAPPLARAQALPVRQFRGAQVKPMVPKGWGKGKIGEGVNETAQPARQPDAPFTFGQVPRKTEVRPAPFMFEGPRDTEVRAAIASQVAAELNPLAPNEPRLLESGAGRTPEIEAEVEKRFRELKAAELHDLNLAQRGRAFEPRNNRTERAMGTVSDLLKRYAPGLASIDTPGGPKTDVLRAAVRGVNVIPGPQAAVLNRISQPREITREEKILDPQAEATVALREKVGETATAFLPFIGAGKLISAAGVASPVLRDMLTFGIADAGRQMAQTGTVDPAALSETLLLGGAMGKIAGLNPSLKRRLVAYVAPALALGVSKGEPPEQIIESVVTNALFAVHGGSKEKAPSPGRVKPQADFKGQTVPENIQQGARASDVRATVGGAQPLELGDPKLARTVIGTAAAQRAKPLVDAPPVEVERKFPDLPERDYPSDIAEVRDRLRGKDANERSVAIEEVGVSEPGTSAPAVVRHVDLQARKVRGKQAGDFKKESKTEREERRAKVAQSVPQAGVERPVEAAKQSASEAPMAEAAPTQTRPASPAPSQVEGVGRQRVLPVDNYRDSLSKHSPIMYREASPARALEMLPSSRISTATPEVFLADSSELALGQGKNKGVMLEFDASKLQGQVNQKPGWEVTYQNGAAEYRATHNKQSEFQGALTSVTVRLDAKMSRVERIQMDRALGEMEQQGWVKTQAEDGSSVYRKVAPEQALPEAKPSYEDLAKADSDASGRIVKRIVELGEQMRSGKPDEARRAADEIRQLEEQSPSHPLVAAAKKAQQERIAALPPKAEPAQRVKPEPLIAKPRPRSETVITPQKAGEIKPEPSTTSARKAQMADDRAELDLPELPPAERKSWQTSLDNARDRLLVERADVLADSVLKKPRALNDEETAGLVLRAQQLKNDHARVMKEIGDAKEPEQIAVKVVERDSIESAFDNVTKATKASGTEKGRALASQKLTINQGYDLVSVVQRMKAAKGRELSASERTKYESMVKERDHAILDRDASLERAHTLELQRQINKTTRQRVRAQTKETLDAEAVTIKSNIVAEFMRLKGTQSSTHSLFGLGNLDPDGVITKELVKYARNRVKANVGLKAEALIDEAHGMVKEFGVTRRQVAEALSGYMKPHDAREIDAATKQLAEIRSEIKNLLAQQDIAAGIRTEKAQGPPRRLFSRNAARLKQLQAKESDVIQRLAARDFSPRKKPPSLPYTREVIAAQDRVTRVENEFRREADRADPWHWLRDISGIRKAGMLSGFITHIRNITGTGAHVGFEEVRRLPSVVADAAMSSMTGQRTVTLSPSAALDGVTQALTVGLREGKQILKHGAPLEQMEKQQFHEINTGVKAVDVAFNSIYRFMSASDRVFYQGTYKRNLVERAQAQAITERRADKSINVRERVKKLTDSPSTEMDADAKHDALVATFNNNNKLSDAIKSGRGRLGPVGNFAVDMVLPFDRTPTNVIARVIEASPAGYAKNAKQIAMSLWRGKMTAAEQRAISETFGRATTGTSIIALGFALAAKGLLTTDDYGTTSLEFRGYKVNLSGVAPMGTLLGVGAGLQKQHSNEGSTKRGYTGAILKPLADQPLLRASSQISEATRDPQRSLTRTAASTAFSFVPMSGAVRMVAKGIDPAEKRYPDSSFKQQFQQGVPGWRQSLPATTDKLETESVIKRLRSGAKIDDKELRGKYSVDQISRMRKVSDMTPAQVKFESKSLDEAVEAYEGKTSEERKEVTAILKKKAESLDDLPESKQSAVRTRLLRLGFRPEPGILRRERPKQSDRPKRPNRTSWEGPGLISQPRASAP